MKNDISASECRKQRELRST